MVYYYGATTHLDEGGLSCTERLHAARSRRRQQQAQHANKQTPPRGGKTKRTWQRTHNQIKPREQTQAENAGRRTGRHRRATQQHTEEKEVGHDAASVESCMRLVSLAICVLGPTPRKVVYSRKWERTDRREKEHRPELNVPPVEVLPFLLGRGDILACSSAKPMWPRPEVKRTTERTILRLLGKGVL